MSENDYTLAWSTESISPSVQRSAMLITHDVTGGFYKLVDMSEFFKGKRAELTYSIRCVYTINDTTQQIVRSESPVLTVESFAPGDDFHYVQTGTSTPAVEYATGRTAAIFKGKFSMQVQYQNSGVKHPYGPFYGKVVCYPTGKHTESTMW